MHLFKLTLGLRRIQSVSRGASSQCTMLEKTCSTTSNCQRDEGMGI